MPAAWPATDLTERRDINGVEERSSGASPPPTMAGLHPSAASIATDSTPDASPISSAFTTSAASTSAITASSATSYPISPLFVVKDTLTSGRGIFALRTIPAGTELLRSSDPALTVLFREYRKEVCSWCFAYEEGRTLAVRDNAAGVVWCSEDCRGAWMRLHGEIGLEGCRKVNEALVKMAKVLPESVDKDLEESGAGLAVGEGRPTEAQIDQAWTDIEQQAAFILQARLSANPKATPKSARKAVASATASSLVDPDILSYQLASVLFFHSCSTLVPPSEGPPSRMESFSALHGSSTPYRNVTHLLNHTASYLRLLTLLPPALLPFCTPSLLRSILGRDTFNSFGIRSLGDSGAEMFGFGLWPSASYWNHSCSPNISKRREGREWVFWSKREISEDEECCISYLGGDEDVHGTVERQQALGGAWGFECGCEKCLEGDQAGAE